MSHYGKLGVQLVFKKRDQATQVGVLVMNYDVTNLCGVDDLANLGIDDVAKDGMPGTGIEEHGLVSVSYKIGVIRESGLEVGKADPVDSIGDFNRLLVVQFLGCFHFL